MKSFLALVHLTCKSAIRSHFFQGMIVLFLVLTLSMPLFVHTDGTAAGYIQITLEYSFSMISWILCISVVWMGASEITSDVENARLHMIVVKPVSRCEIYLAKFLGILLCHAVLLVLASLFVYGLTIYRGLYGDWSEEEKQLLQTEVFVGRKVYRPDSVEPQISEQTVKEMLSRLEEVQREGKQLPPEWLRFKDKTGKFTRERILQEIQSKIRLEANHIAPMGVHYWRFSGLPKDMDGNFRIRCKMYTSETQSDQMPAEGMWGWRYMRANPQLKQSTEAVKTLDGMPDKNIVWFDVLFMPKSQNCEFLTYRTQEFQVYPKNTSDSVSNEKNATYYVTPAPFHLFKESGEMKFPISYPSEDVFMTKDGKGILLFQSLETKKDLYTQEKDGPFLLVPEISFSRNFLRAGLAVFFNIVIFAMLGISFSAIFSLSSGIFITVAYVLFCQIASFLSSIYDMTVVRPHGVMEMISYYFCHVAKVIFVNLGNSSAAKMLATGEMVEWSFLGRMFLFDVLLRMALFFLLGLWCYHRRELGTAAKGM